MKKFLVVVRPGGYDTSVELFEMLEDALCAYRDAVLMGDKAYISQLLPVKFVVEIDGDISDGFQVFDDELLK